MKGKESLWSDFFDIGRVAIMIFIHSGESGEAYPLLLKPNEGSPMASPREVWNMFPTVGRHRELGLTHSWES